MKLGLWGWLQCVRLGLPAVWSSHQQGVLCQIAGTEKRSAADIAQELYNGYGRMINGFWNLSGDGRYQSPMGMVAAIVMDVLKPKSVIL